MSVLMYIVLTLFLYTVDKAGYQNSAYENNTGNLGKKYAYVIVSSICVLYALGWENESSMNFALPSSIIQLWHNYFLPIP